MNAAIALLRYCRYRYSRKFETRVAALRRKKKVSVSGYIEAASASCSRPANATSRLSRSIELRLAEPLRGSVDDTRRYRGNPKTSG